MEHRTSIDLQPVAISIVPLRLLSHSFSLERCLEPNLRRESIRFPEKEWRLKEYATNFVVFKWTWLNLPVARNSRSHFSFVLRAVLRCESTPSEADGQDREVAEESAAYNVVLGAMEFEKEVLTWLQDTKLSPAAGLPEVDLVDRPICRKIGKPVVVRNRHVETHRS